MKYRLLTTTFASHRTDIQGILKVVLDSHEYQRGIFKAYTPYNSK